MNTFVQKHQGTVHFASSHVKSLQQDVVLGHHLTSELCIYIMEILYASATTQWKQFCFQQYYE